jgi:hypothetical protein
MSITGEQERRRGRDSNPRLRNIPNNGFRDRRLQPLGHLSTCDCKCARPHGSSYALLESHRLHRKLHRAHRWQDHCRLENCTTSRRVEKEWLLRTIVRCNRECSSTQHCSDPIQAIRAGGALSALPTYRSSSTRRQASEDRIERSRPSRPDEKLVAVHEVRLSWKRPTRRCYATR